MRIFRLSISVTLIAGALTAGCTRPSDSPQTPSQLTTQTVASGSFIAERTVTVEEMQEILAFESLDPYFGRGKPAVGWKTKSVTTTVDSTMRTLTEIQEKELIEFQAERAIYKLTSSESDSAGYSLTNSIWIGALPEYINGTSMPTLEVSKTPGVETGDPKIRRIPTQGNLQCGGSRSKKTGPAIIEVGTYRFSDGTTFPVAFRVQESRIARLFCGERGDIEQRGRIDKISIVAPNNLTLFSGSKTRLDNGVFVYSKVEETVSYKDIRTK